MFPCTSNLRSLNLFLFSLPTSTVLGPLFDSLTLPAMTDLSIHLQSDTFPSAAFVQFLSRCESLERLQMKEMSLTKDEVIECVAVVPTLHRFLFRGMYAQMLTHSSEGAELYDALHQAVAERPNLVVWIESIGVQKFVFAKGS